MTNYYNYYKEFHVTDINTSFGDSHYKFFETKVVIVLHMITIKLNSNV